MAHLVYTDARSRLEMNLDEDEAAIVTEFLLCLVTGDRTARSVHVATRGRAPKPGRVQPEPPNVARSQVDGPLRIGDQLALPAKAVTETFAILAKRGVGKTSLRLLPKACEWDGCGTVFQPTRASARFCSDSCRHAYYNGRRGRRGRSVSGGPVKCPECDATFKSAQGLGGHMNSHTRARRAGQGKARQNGKVTAPAVVEPDRTLPVPEHTPRVAKAEAAPAPKVTPPGDRPYRCKEPGCGHPCRSQGELNSHQVAYHQAEPLPVTTKVAAALTFPCPECDRVYDDSNRLTHHLRVVHDDGRVDPVHVVEVHTPAQAVKVG